MLLALILIPSYISCRGIYDEQDNKVLNRSVRNMRNHFLRYYRIQNRKSTGIAPVKYQIAAWYLKLGLRKEAETFLNAMSIAKETTDEAKNHRLRHYLQKKNINYLD